MRYVIIIQAATFEDLDNVELPAPAPAWRPDRDEDRKVHRHEYGVDASRKRIAARSSAISPSRQWPGAYEQWANLVCLKA